MYHEPYQNAGDSEDVCAKGIIVTVAVRNLLLLKSHDLWN
jgi:hypothetical protein